MFIRRFPIVLIIGAIVLSACASATPTPDTMMEEPAVVMTEEPMDDRSDPSSDSMEKPTEDMADPTAEDMAEDKMQDDKEEMEATPEPMQETSDVMAPDWFSATLINVNTDARFKIEDYKGKVVLVETLAMWCSTCRNQQKQVVALHDLLGEREDFISLGLDIDPNELAEDLTAYTQNNGFNWTYAISPPKVSNEIAELYGNQFLNPPSAPMFIIDRKGEVHALRFGVKSAEELLEALQPFLDEAM